MLDIHFIQRLTAAVGQVYGELPTLVALHPTELPQVEAGCWAEFQLTLGQRVHAWYEERGVERALTIASAPPAAPQRTDQPGRAPRPPGA